LTAHKTQLVYDVPYADVDMMGFVYYAHYLVYFERARSQMLAEMAYPYWEMEKQGFGLPVIEAHVEYKAPATYGDRLDIYAAAAWIKPVRLQINCEVYRAGALLASGHTVHCCVDMKRKRPTRLPDAFIAACGGLTAAGGGAATTD